MIAQRTPGVRQRVQRTERWILASYCLLVFGGLAACALLSWWAIGNYGGC